MNYCYVDDALFSVMRGGRSTLYLCFLFTFVDLTKNTFSQPKTITFFPDLPQVFKSAADHSSIKLSFCSLPAKIPLVTLLAGLLLFLFDGLQVMWTARFNLRGNFFLSLIVILGVARCRASMLQCERGIFKILPHAMALIPTLWIYVGFGCAIWSVRWIKVDAKEPGEIGSPETFLC